MSQSAPQERIARPELTLPEAEADLVRALYAAADVILEYGSGGSTILASELSDKTVFSVESDLDWAQMMRSYLEQNPPAKGTEVDVIWSDIGPTKEWGFPRNAKGWDRYARYPLQVWDLKEFRAPDVVLVDGRFRIGCALATAFRTAKPVTLLFDDYKRRKEYHVVEEYFGAPTYAGRMARFELTPMTVPPDRLLHIVEMMSRP